MKRNKFSLSHYHLLSANLGSLIPIGWQEVLPGDTFQQATSCLIRVAPIATPVMHPVHIRIHHFFVPNRIMWTSGGSDPTNPGWESYITGGKDGLDNQTPPYIGVGGNQTVSTLQDYLGLSTHGFTGANYEVSALPFRAYAMIWNEYFRDEDLQTALTVGTGGGNDSTTNVVLQQVNWPKDYYTTVRSQESKGSQVLIPISGAAKVAGIGIVDGTVAANSPAGYRDGDGNTGATPSVQTTTAGIYVRTGSTGATGAGNVVNVLADLGTATNASINSLRQAFGIQRYQEARLRWGSRYVEYLMYLGIRPSDARLQRPEYLGGGRSTVQFSEVMQTAPTTSGTQFPGAGQYSGHGISALRTNRYRRFFEEHGIVMSLLSVVPAHVLTQQVRRAWFRGVGGGAAAGTAIVGMNNSKLDYFTRELQHMGQQQVNGLEIDASCQNTAFGFQDRYDEYRRMENVVTGNFRLSGGTNLDFWNFAREFSSPPALNSAFVSCVPTNRMFQNLSADTLYIMAHHSIQARRMLSKTGSSFVA